MPRKLLILMAYIIFAILNACSDENPESVFEPSFVSTRFAMLGSSPESARSASLKKIKWEVFSCANDEKDNKVYELAWASEPMTYNLRKGNRFCRARILSLSFGGENPLVFLPESDSDFLEFRQRFVNEKADYDLIVFRGYQLREQLEKFEKLSYFILPESSANSAQAKVRIDEAGSSEQPGVRILLDRIEDKGLLTSGRQAVKVYFRCEKVREFSRCSGQELSDYRMYWFSLDENEVERSLAGLSTKLSQSQNIVRPRVVHLYKNGLSFDWLVPQNSDSSNAQRIILIIALGDEYRSFDFYLEDWI